jgi:hypothetical protein
MHELTSTLLGVVTGSPAALSASPWIVAVFVALVVWTLVIKGFALWSAARAQQKYWFVALLLINTFGILEVIYLIWFRPLESDDSAVSSETV